MAIVPKTGGKEIAERRSEWDPFAGFRQEMNRLMESFFGGVGLEPFESRRGSFQPKVDVVDTEKELKVTAELPGMEEKDIDVSITKDSLTIRGEKKEEKEESGKDFYRMERTYGSFNRMIPLPKEVETEKVTATFKKGVLTVTLPKTKQALTETKKIKIKAQ